MENEALDPSERRRAPRHPLDEDRFDNDGGEELRDPTGCPSEYEARLERMWKHAKWRTELWMRQHESGDGTGDFQGMV